MDSCSRCKHQDKREHEEPCVGCVHNAVENFEPMTNADRIRNMTDEELAEFLSDITYYCRGRQDRYRCHECSLQKCGACNEICIGEWLKSEVGCE